MVEKYRWWLRFPAYFHARYYQSSRFRIGKIRQFSLNKTKRNSSTGSFMFLPTQVENIYMTISAWVSQTPVNMIHSNWDNVCVLYCVGVEQVREPLASNRLFSTYNRIVYSVCETGRTRCLDSLVYIKIRWDVAVTFTKWFGSKAQRVLVVVLIVVIDVFGEAPNCGAYMCICFNPNQIWINGCGISIIILSSSI